MELTLVAMTLAIVGVVISLVGARSAAEARTARRLGAIEYKLQMVMDHLGIVPEPPAMPDVLAQLSRGNKIQAIKAYRDATGAGLKEAKDAVEAMARQYGL